MKAIRALAVLTAFIAFAGGALAEEMKRSPVRDMQKARTKRDESKKKQAPKTAIAPQEPTHPTPETKGSPTGSQ